MIKWLSWSIKNLWGIKVMYCYVLLKLLFLIPQSYFPNQAATSIYSEVPVLAYLFFQNKPLIYTGYTVDYLSCHLIMKHEWIRLDIFIHFTYIYSMHNCVGYEICIMYAFFVKKRRKEALIISWGVFSPEVQK